MILVVVLAPLGRHGARPLASLPSEMKSLQPINYSTRASLVAVHYQRIFGAYGCTLNELESIHNCVMKSLTSTDALRCALVVEADLQFGFSVILSVLYDKQIPTTYFCQKNTASVFVV